MSEVVSPRYLTKTRFKLAAECPAKLFFTGKPDVYADTKQEDDFLKALAEGGFQVGELAKLMYPGGHNIQALNHAKALAQTRALLELPVVTIFEAAIQHGDFFVRVDVLRKVHHEVELIEVKAKSFDSSEGNGFRRSDGSIRKDMLPYLQDVAFQRHVLGLAYPKWTVRSFLLLADKSKTCSVDGLNQKFKIHRTASGRTHVQVQAGLTGADIGDPLLTCVDVGDCVHDILNQPMHAPGRTALLAEVTQDWGQHYRTDTRIHAPIGAHCASCEFRTVTSESSLKSGFHECWGQATGWSDAQINKDTVLDIWNFRRKQELMDSKILQLDKVTKTHLKYSEGEEGLSTSQRQWMQVRGEWPGGGAFYLDRDLMASAMAKWTFPLHFIDFETARVAIPFYQGQRPYDNIAFQFSHHVVQSDGSVAHQNQFLSATPGKRPNYEFVRQLNMALGSQGTVFIWSPHENTTLNAILDELENDGNPPPDAPLLRKVILDLTVLKRGTTVVRQGARQFVDLCLLAKRAYFHPITQGSSSIKKVLPAVLHSSKYLRDRYSAPVYGAVGGIPSLNFTNQVWWQQTHGVVCNPYHLLPPVFSDLPQQALDGLETGQDMEIAEGGAATMAFARLQFDSLPGAERQSIESALLRYCELDTLAMVMVYEAWREAVHAPNVMVPLDVGEQ